MFAPGYILQNRYRIVRQLGAGGMGAVYLAQHLGLAGKSVAVKENVGGDLHQFQFEAVMLANLNHPNLPRVIDHFIEGAAQYLVMDYVEGQNLDSMVQQYGAVPESNALTWMSQVLDAVKYLHANHIIHRDIKPQNIIITPQGKAVLTDFGIAKVLVAGHSTSTGARAGSPGYAPPEQYVGGTTERSDIYSLGATLYHILTGCTPPESPNRAIGAPLTPPRQVNRNISANTEIVVLRAMDLLANQRYGSIAEMEQALRAIPKTLLTPPQRIQSLQQLPTSFMQASRLRQFALIGSIIVVLCLCLVLASAVGGISYPSTPTLTFAPLPSHTVAPQITVLVYSPTPALPTFTPIPTRVPPTLTSEPTQTPKPSSTAAPMPTQTPTDTPANTVLDVNKKWRQQSLEMLVQNARFSNVTCKSLFEFDLSLENTEPGELVISWKGDEISVVDDTGKSYDVFYQPAPRDPADCGKYKPIKDMSKTALAGKESYKIGIAVRGALPESTKDFTVTIGRVGTRIQNAKWKIPLPR